jgi:hypothetical protein
MTPDQINGIFEFCGGLFILTSIFKLYKDKQVKGVTLAHPIFFFLWGLWNLYFYPHLNQMFSFYGGIMVAFTNLIWICQIIYYRKRK